MPYDSQEAKNLNIDIFETIYHTALESSCELAAQEGYYETWPGSAGSNGVLQCDMWGITPSDRWDRRSLRAKIAQHGLRNSLLVASMPTADTSQISGFNDSVEPFVSNLHTRRMPSTEIQIFSPIFVSTLLDLGLWNIQMGQRLEKSKGSVQAFEEIPQAVRNIFRTAWEMDPKILVDLAIDRAPFICQSQSMSLYIHSPRLDQLTNLHFYAWKNGLKTGMYHLLAAR